MKMKITESNDSQGGGEGKLTMRSWFNLAIQLRIHDVHSKKRGVFNRTILNLANVLYIKTFFYWCQEKQRNVVYIGI